MMFFKQILFLIFFRLVISANPENVTCKLRLITSEWLTMDCWIYPSGELKEININNKTYSSSTETQVSSICRLAKSDQGKLFNTSKCSIDIELTVFEIGNNNINIIASSEVVESNFTMSSNFIVIPLYDDIQEPVCYQPIYDDSKTFSIYSSNVYFTVKCVTPLTLRKVYCTFNSRSNGTVERNKSGSIDYVLDEMYTVAIQCERDESTSTSGYGLPEFQATLYWDHRGEKINPKSSNWTEPVHFYTPTNINLTINGSPQGVNVSFGDEITVKCSVDSLPPVVLLLDHEDGGFPSEPRRTLSRTITTSITSCTDSFLYTCKGGWTRATLGQIFSKTVFVNVPCRYRALYNRNLQSNVSYVGTFKNTTSVKFQVLGYPKPISMKLSKSMNSNNFLTEADGVDIVFNEEMGPLGTIEVNFKNAHLIGVYSHFFLKVDNGVGTSYFDFYVSLSGNSGFVVPSICLFLFFFSLMSNFII